MKIFKSKKIKRLKIKKLVLLLLISFFSAYFLSKLSILKSDIFVNLLKDISINKITKNKKLELPILAVPMDLRHMCFVILSEFVSNLRVLACEELVSDYNIKFVGKV